MKEPPTTAAAARCAVVLLLLASLAPGCSLPGQKLAACKAEKEQLLASIQEKQNRLMVLEAEKRQTDQRLAQAEKSVALLHDNRADIQRLASRPDSPGGDSRTAPSTSLAPTSPSADADTDAATGGASDAADAWTQRSQTTRE
jgi:hypothetical protein